MNPTSGPRQQLHEFFLEIRLTKRKHVVVEGRADQRFLRSWLDDVGGTATAVEVTAVETLDVPDADLFAMQLTDSNRSRVIVVAARASDGGTDLRCIADRDCGHDVDQHNYETLLWTDFPALESYAVEVRALDKANLLNFGGFLPDADVLLEQLSFALGELWAVRCQHQHLDKPDYKAGLKNGDGTLREFDVRLAVHPSIRPNVAGYERPAYSDPRAFAYGHDVGELLMAAFGNELKNKAGLKVLAAVEGALRSAMHVVGSFADEPMFIQLKEWALVN